jgi:4-diphosphocytidyl-2-C-methyl-D-erythritol kinase
VTQPGAFHKVKFSLRAPAKINWFLSVLGRRRDGYHDIVSPMQCVSLFDVLDFEESDRIELESEMDIPAEENLVYRAAVLLREHASYQGGAKIALRKEIPSAAGLGGGSSDAAFTLIGLNRLWGLRMGTAELMRLAGALGSDVPFFINGPFSLIEGRGEKVSTLAAGSPVSMLLVNPDLRVSTAWAYGSYEVELTKKDVDIKLFCQALAGRDFSSLRGMIFNDLERPVIGKHPVVARIREMLIANGAVISCMSGSGPTVFGVFRSEGQALEAAAKMGAYWSRVVHTLHQYDVWEEEKE